MTLRQSVKRLARARRLPVGRLVQLVLEREVERAKSESGSEVDESAIREMAILVAVELAIKLLEANIPGGPTLSSRLVNHAAQAAIARVEMIEATLHEESA